MNTAGLMAVLRKKPLLVACIVLSIVLAVAIYLRSDAVSAANAALDRKSSDARRYALNISNAVQLRRQLQQLTADEKAIQARLIRPSEIGINQQFFYQLESDSGVKLIELSQSPQPRGHPVKFGQAVPVLFNVSFQGHFRQVIAFLRGLEDGTHFCRVLEASCDGGRNTRVKVTLTLEMLGQP